MTPDPRELEKRRTMRSFRNLFYAAVKDPESTARLIDHHSGCPEPYPGHYAAIFLLGMIRGTLLQGTLDHRLISLVDGHKEFLDFSPADFIGSQRKWAKGRGM